MAYTARKYPDGWRTILNGEVGSKLSHSQTGALEHGRKVELGLVVWESVSSSAVRHILSHNDPSLSVEKAKATYEKRKIR